MIKPRSSACAAITNAILIALALGLLGHVLWNNRLLVAEVFRRDLDFRLLALAFLCYMVATLLTFVRWYWLVRVIEPSFRFDAAILLGFVGNLFNLLIPGAVGGDLVKAAYLTRMDVNKTSAFASMGIDRLIGLLGLFVVAAIAGTINWSHSTVEIQRLVVIVWVAVGLSILGLALIVSTLPDRLRSRYFTRPGRIKTLMGELVVMSSIYRKRPGVFIASLAISFLTQGVYTISFYLVGKTLLPSNFPSFGEHLLMVPLIFFTMAAPLPFGAIGVGEEISEQLFLLVAHPGGALALMGFRVLVYGGALVSAAFYGVYIRQLGHLSSTPRVLHQHHLKKKTTILK